MPDSASPAFTIIVCTRDRAALLDRCLQSLKTLDYPHYEVLVIDNASSDDQASHIAARHGVRYIHTPEAGLSKARNLGMQQSEAQIFAFIDDDAVAPTDWLKMFAEEFVNPAVDIVTGIALPLFEGEPVGPVCDSTDHERLVVHNRTMAWFTLTNFGAAGNSNMALRRSCLEVWMGFHEKLGRGQYLDALEEHYAFFQLVKAGKTLVFTPKVRYFHRIESESAASQTRAQKDLTASVAYLMFLFFDHAGHRLEIIRFLARAVDRRLRPANHTKYPAPFPAIRLTALFSGMRLYWRFRASL